MKTFSAHFLVKCYSCGFVFTERIPTGEELVKHYANYPSIQQLSPVTKVRYNELLDYFEKYRKAGNMLDVGCGNGLFLEVAKQRGWKVFGTEFTEANAENCRKKQIEIFCGDITSCTFAKNSFDVVVSFEVIEHINNPVDFVSSVSGFLRKGGIFYFTTPNFNALNKYLLGSKWNIVEYPEHLGYFTKQTAHRLLVSCGFEKQKLLTTGINLNRYKASKNSETVMQESSDAPNEILRQKIEQRKILQLAKNSVNFILDVTRLGDSLKGFYLKS